VLFRSCTSLTDLIISDGVNKIDASAFCGCTSLTSVIIPGSVTSIGERAFRDCASLVSIIIPDSVTWMEAYVFDGCTSLTYNRYNDGQYLGNDRNPYVILVRADTAVTSFGIHPDTKFIYEEAFSRCDSLTAIIIPDRVIRIGARAFSGCTRLNKMIIQSEEIQIGRNAFEDIEENIEFYVSSKSVRSELEDYGIDEALIILGDENDEENDEFRLKIIAGDGGTVSGSGYYKYGEKVTIKAYPKDGYEFESWEIISGKPKIANDTEKKTTLKMPDDSVKVKANFTYVGTEGLPSQSDIDEFDKIYVTNLYGNNLMGENVSLNISDDGRISTGKFSKVIGTQAELTASAQDYKWTVNGSDIRTDIKDKAYCNFKVDFFKPNNWEIGYLTEYKNIIQFKLAEDTELPFEGTLEFNLDLNEDFTRVYLYKYDEQAQKITYSGFSDVAKKEFNTVKFKISYGGEYVVTSQIIKNSFVNMTFENNKNINSIVPYYLENNIPRPIIQSAVVGDTLSFKADKTAFYGYIDNYQGFLDIEDSWAKEAIEFVSARRIVNGSTQTLFEPEIILTKADFLEGLARVDGQSQNAVLWARSNGIVSETSDT